MIFQGFKKIAHVTSAPYLSITKERLEGYKDALAKHEISFNESLVRYCTHGGMLETEVDDALASLFKSKTKPDAIFAAGDRLTITCFSLLKNMKLKKEAGFIGFSNTGVGDLFYPSLSIIRQPASDIGQSAIEFLIQIIESKRPVTEFQHKVLDTELIIRESSKKRMSNE